MKKQFKSKLIKLIPIVLLFVLSMFLISCQGTGTTGGTNNPEKLAAPQVLLNGNTAQWVANPNADKFEISVDGALSYLENTVTSRILANGETFKIRAIGDGTKYSNSDWSNEVTCCAQESYTVTFKDYDGTILKTENVKKGENATAPDVPEREYFVFVGWDNDYENITANTVVTAIYKEVVVMPTDPIFVISSAEVVNGETEVKITISLLNNPGIASAKLIVEYDKVLTLETVEYNEEIGGMSMQPQSYNSPVIVNWFNGLENSYGDFVFVTLTFDISDVAEGEYYISLNYDENDVYDISEQNIKFDIIDGKISIS